MADKTAAEKLGLSPDEKCVFLNVEKAMPAPSQNLLDEGKLSLGLICSLKQTAECMSKP